MAQISDLESKIGQRKNEAQDKGLFEQVRQAATVLGKYAMSESEEDRISFYRREGWKLRKKTLTVFFRQSGWLDDKNAYQEPSKNMAAEVILGQTLVFYEEGGFPAEPGETVGVKTYLPGKWEGQLRVLCQSALEKTKKHEKCIKLEAEAKKSRN